MVLLSIILSVKYFRNNKTTKSILLTVVGFLFVYNAFVLNSSFNNKYIFDLQDDITKIASTAPCSIFIEEKEFNRIGQENNHYIASRIPCDPLNSFLTAKKFLKSYSLYGQDIFLVSYDYNNSVKKANSDLNLDLKEIRSYISNKIKRKVSIYKFNTECKIDLPADRNGLNNLITNGDCEVLLRKEDKQKKLQQWINQGDSFYTQDSIDLPQNSVLVPVFSPYDKDSFPEVYIEKNNPISGKYSLFVKFKPKSRLPVYLFNQVPSTEGVFSFSVKALNDDKQFKLFIHSYSNNKSGATVPPFSTYYFSLEKNKVFQIAIKVDKEMVLGDRMIFMLYSNDVELILDNLSFIPDTQSNG